MSVQEQNFIAYLGNFIHDISVFSRILIQVVNLSRVRVQVVEKWRVIGVEGVVTSANHIRIITGAQTTIYINT